MHSYPFQVRFSECDGLGHVNNTVYFVYMEEARTDLFRIFNPSLDLNRWNLIIASATCDFRKQATYADKLVVHTYLSKVGSSSMVVEHKIMDEHMEMVAEGKAVMVFFDYEQQKTAPIPESIRSELQGWLRDE
jgi:acyl-CoA thioester hydrolase